MLLKNIYNIRKHIADTFIWTQRVPVVVDLTADDLAAEDLSKHLAAKGEFAFPALDIAAPRKIKRDTLLSKGKSAAALIICPDKPVYRRIAAKLSMMPSGIELPVMDAGTFDMRKFRRFNWIVLGNSNENPVSRHLAFKNLCYANNLVPGNGGVYIQSINSLLNKDQNIIIAAADESSAEELIERFKQGIIRVDEICKLKRIDVTKLAPVSSSLTGTPDTLVKSIAENLARLGDGASSIEEMADSIVKAFDSGGRELNRDNGHCTIPNMVRLYDCYRYTGDERFLKAFKKTIIGLCDYFLKIPGGASYPSDYDFYLGNLICRWSLAEADEIFSDEERHLITAVLLASARTIEKYAEKFWAVKKNQFRFNHETFPSLSMFWAARYFGGCYNIPDAKRWRSKAKLCFSGPINSSFHGIENSNLYQWLISCHKLIYDCAAGTGGVIKNGIAAKTAMTSIVTTDNFGFAAPYGDCEPVTWTSGQLPLHDAAAALCGIKSLAGLAHRSRAALKNEPYLFLPNTGWGTLLAPELSSACMPECGEWEIAPLEKHVKMRNNSKIPAKYLYDKIALRSGWNDDDQYMLFEPYSCDIHSHYDMNSIISYNHCGRMWLVDNGYGKPCGETNLEKAYNSREVGPRDHNTLIFYDKAEKIIIPPPFCAVTSLERDGNIFLLESLLGNIKGAAWLRSIIICLNNFMLVIDRVSVGDASGLSKIELQFNALGEDNFSDGLWILDQRGAKLWTQFSGPGIVSRGSYMTSGWEETFNKNYNYAEAPVKKLSREIASLNNGDEFTFTTLFCAGKDKFPKFTLDNTKVSGAFKNPAGIKTHYTSLVCGEKGGGLTFDLKPVSAFPKGLTDDIFGTCGPRPFVRENVLRKT